MIPFKKNQLALFCAAPLIVGQAFGLGLGNAETASQLGAPLEADIPLTKLGKLGASDIRIRLASRSDHERLGVESTLFHQQLRFKPVIEGQSGLIQVTSEMPVHEPFLNFVLSVEWPGGHLLREYTVLLDPTPAFAPLPALISNTPVATRPALATPAVPQRFASDTVVQPGDSLWRLARRMPRPAGTNLAQVMNALYAANPSAFVNGDPNRLKALSPIKKPGAADIEQAARAFSPTQVITASDSASAVASPAVAPQPQSMQADTAPSASGSNNNAAMDPDLADQLAGLKAGVAAAEAGKVKTRADILELEEELSLLVARYQMLADKTANLEQALDERDASPPASVAPAPLATLQPSLEPGASTAAPTPADQGTPWIWLGMVVGGALLGGYLLGHTLPVARKTKVASRVQAPAPAKAKPKAAEPAVSKMKSSLPGRKSKSKGSDTFENPFAGYDKDTRDDAAVVAGAYAAFGMVDQAEAALTEAILKEPTRSDLKLQLLELYTEANDQEGFEDLAESLAASDQDPAVIAEIEQLRQQINAGSDADNTNVTDITPRLSVNQ